MHPFILCAIKWSLGMWDMEEEVESFSWKELHAKNVLGCPIFGFKMEESISILTLNSFHLFSHVFNSSCHQMTLGIMGAEEKGESFFWKEFEHRIEIGMPHILEYMEESLIYWTLDFPMAIIWCSNFFSRGRVLLQIKYLFFYALIHGIPCKI